MSEEAFEKAQREMSRRAWKVRIIGACLCASSAGLILIGELVAGMVAVLGAILWIGTQERVGTEVKGLSKQVAAASGDLRKDAKAAIKEGFVELKDAMPDFNGIQIDGAALAAQLVPALQEALSGSMKGIKGSEEAGLRRAAKFIREGMPDESQIPLLEAIDAGDPEALQIAQAGKMFAKMLPALSEKSPLMADYGETFIQAIPTLFAMRQQRKSGVTLTTAKGQGGFNPGVR